VSGPLNVGFAGGMPPILGGGGLEIQMSHTAAALERRGHRVVRVECAPPDLRLDILHGFQAETWLDWAIPHWKRSRCPIVVSPVLTVRPGLEQRLMRFSRHLPFVNTSARQRAHVMSEASAVVVLTAHEREITLALGADPGKISMIGNGVARYEDDELEPPPHAPDPPFALMVGNVSERKQQRAVLAATTQLRFVVVGGFEGSEDERRHWDRTVEQAGATWLGEIDDPASVRALQRAATATVLYSRAEGLSLAALESLSVGTPIVVSEIPAHRELAGRFPGLVHIVGSAEAIGPALQAIAARPRPTPAPIPGWDDVAAELEAVYLRVLDA